MPDIQSALQAALAQTASAWAADDMAHQTIQPQQESEMKPEKVYFSVTNNVCRTTFDFVRDNPGMTRVEISKELAKQGFNSKSVSSLLGQMLRQGLVYANNNLLYTNSNEYTPIKSSKVLRARAETPVQKKIPSPPKAAPKVLYTQGIYQLKPEPAAPHEWSPSDVIDKLTVRQALALFKELRNILVG